MITRFAPSPTGPLHLGHAYSAFQVWVAAATYGGQALLRIEDTDSTRVRPQHEAGIYEDLAWLGLSWPTPVMRQSTRGQVYDVLLARLDALGLVYPCSCTRRDIVDAGAVQGADGFVYPGTCRHKRMQDGRATDAVRFNVMRASALVGSTLDYVEKGHGPQQTIKVQTSDIGTTIGDPVLRRKDTRDPAYHLACVHDDHDQQITHVVRGRDLEALTPLHVLLQRVLGYKTPVYHHHALILDEDGKRLAKIDKSKALSKYRAEGQTPQDIKRLIGLSSPA